MLEVVNLRKSYKDIDALRGVDLHIAGGEIVGVLGRNGAGKTTMASIFAGTCPLDGGSVHIDGLDISRRPVPARRKVGYAAQEISIYPVLSVRENLRFFGELCGLRGRGLRERCEEVAAAVRLEGHLARRGSDLSGGEKRRLHTGIALMGRPLLLILDEVTAGVDTQSRAVILALVRKLATEGAAVYYSTHYLPEIEEIGASVVILKDGLVAARGAIESVVAEHCQPMVRVVFSAEPLLGPISFPTRRRGPVVEIYADAPSVILPRVLAEFGSASETIRSVELVQPSLESAYLRVTGEPDDETPLEKIRDVALA
ncbi:ABC transporter ATP-binding protein [Frankia sp. Cppng1_Ct_nod]|uniref:ABC transporter ATP-binding protein n=1 Tax=Frankia sp. Cppng1_Ct_nod TaxID=2897162 RepID=UPI00104158F1|nr:ABC transporter ATP-binding protein [Frankia sp. Cppng1_Ct_nod]